MRVNGASRDTKTRIMGDLCPTKEKTQPFLMTGIGSASRRTEGRWVASTGGL